MEHFGKRSTLYVLHRHEVRGAGATPVVHGDDVRVVEIRRSLCLTTETLDEGGVCCEFRKENFDRNGSVEQEIARQEHVRHATATDALVDFVSFVDDGSVRIRHKSSLKVS